jgi:hypothetical protein
LLQAAMPCEDAGNSTQANSFMIQHRPATKSQCTTARTHDLGPLQCRSPSTNCIVASRYCKSSLIYFCQGS